MPSVPHGAAYVLLVPHAERSGSSRVEEDRPATRMMDSCFSIESEAVLLIHRPGDSESHFLSVLIGEIRG